MRNYLGGMGSYSASLASSSRGNDRYLKQGRDLTCLWWLDDGQAQKYIGNFSKTVNSQNQQAQRCTELNPCNNWQVRVRKRNPSNRLPGFVYDPLSMESSPGAEL